MKTKPTAVIALTVILHTALPAQAQPPGNPGVVVRWSDLDLATSAGVQTLYQRIQSAAWSVCLKEVSRPATLEVVLCRHALVDDTVQRINEPHLTALHAGR
jgi:UrcA family protein